MTRDYFRKGGPFNAKRIDQDNMRWEVPIEGDEEGRVARQCPNETCSPGYFKVLFGTGITDEQEYAFCPYCRHKAEPNDFLSEEQVRYFEEVLLNEASHAFDNMLKSSIRNNKYIKYQPGQIKSPRRPFEDEVQRNVICPNCTLDHAVYGLATWCPDCGTDIFLAHIEAELDVVRTMLADLERREKSLGRRAAAKDLENCLEDVVSIYEAVLKAILVRHFESQGKSNEEIQNVFKKSVRNGFQNIERAETLIRELTIHDLYANIDDASVASLKAAFDMRHPITHNLGVVDRKYIERSMQGQQEGSEIRISKEEILDTLDTIIRVFRSAHEALIGDSTSGQ